jgi:hypothetical protein
MAEKKEDDKVVSATLATGTKVTAPQSVIDKVKGQAERDAANARKK